MDIVNDTATFHYQSFSPQIETSTSNLILLCGCDYCLNYHPYKLKKCGLNSVSKNEIIKMPSECKNLRSVNLKHDDEGLLIPRAKSMSELNKTERIFSREGGASQVKNNNDLNKSSFEFYDLWQSEKFKANAFEKDNERLELRVKHLENKLEKETQQQIRISLEWRKTVMKLVDENMQLKLQVQSCKLNEIE